MLAIFVIVFAILTALFFTTWRNAKEDLTALEEKYKILQENFDHQMIEVSFYEDAFEMQKEDIFELEHKLSNAHSNLEMVLKEYDANEVLLERIAPRGN